MTLIYHGTPLSPRAALMDVLPGRAACVSFFRPDDVEAVEAVCPYLMFRQRRVQLLDAGAQVGARVGVGSGLDALLSVVGGSAFRAGPVGGDTGCTGGTLPAQRRDAQRLAIRAQSRGSTLAHGRPAGALSAALRALRPGGTRLDWRPKEGTCGLRSLPSPHGGSRQAARQSLAAASHDARGARGSRLPFLNGRQHQPRAERTSL